MSGESMHLSANPWIGENHRCKACGQNFTPCHAVQIYCSRLCQKRDARNREILHPTAGRPPSKCEYCGKEFIPKGTDRKRFCSRECWYALVFSKPSVRRFSPIWFRECAHCEKSFVARTPGQTRCSRQCIRDAANARSKSPEAQLIWQADNRRRTLAKWIDRHGGQKQGCCPECGTIFNPLNGTGRRIYCSVSCGKAAGKYHHHILRRLRGEKLMSKVTRNEIMQRDGFRCQLCGGKVNTKGSWLHYRAPEIDHIVPLSQGGAHNLANLQLTHRICNQMKGIAVVGQLRLC